MRTVFSLLICGAVLGVSLGVATHTVRADKAFRDEFLAKYVKADSSDPKERAFAEACDKAKCSICHEGKSKKNRNAYGKALGKLLSRESDKENKPKIRAALDKVAAMNSDPDDPKSPKFGDLIKEGKIPGSKPKEGNTLL